MTYYGANRKTYILDDIPIKKGGEGAIHTVSGKSNLLAKIYLAPAKSPELKEKISLMVKNPPRQDILDQIAWPIDILSDASGNFVGFVMPKLSIDVELGDVYKYPAKKKVTLTGEQKVIIAINICRVISAIHDLDYVFGDFNPCNIGVNLTNGHVAFLDTDSYHITDKSRGKTYRCNVCLNGYVAPELIKKCKNTGYAQAPLPTFTKETDLFSLAIHIFKLLMNGFTPYNGIPENERSSTASPGVGNAAIEMDHYCFKAGNRPLSVAVLPLQAFPSDIQRLFARAFDEGHQNPSKRPTANEWDAVLTSYLSNLKKCSTNPMHHYYKGLQTCPYCEADQRYNFTISMSSVYGTSSGSPSSGQMSFPTPMTPPPTPPSGSSYTSSSNNSSGSGQYSGTVLSGSGSSTRVSQRSSNGFSRKLPKAIIISVLAIVLVVGGYFGITTAINNNKIEKVEALIADLPTNPDYYIDYHQEIVEAYAAYQELDSKLQDKVENADKLFTCMESLEVEEAYEMQQNLQFTEANGGYAVSVKSDRASKLNGNVEIPSTYRGKPVTTIPSNAFLNCSQITSIIVPDSVVSIGSGAFGGCTSLKEITLPFVGKNISPENPRWSVFGYIFGDGEYNDDNMNREDKVYKTSGTSGFTSQISEGSGGYFYFTIPKSLKKVTVTLQTNIPNYAFNNCDLLENVVFVNDLKQIGDYAFSGCTNLSQFNINYGVESIGIGAFMNCRAFDTIDIPNSVTSIGRESFVGCSKITNIIIPDSVKSIGSGAFGGCNSLKEITLPFVGSDSSPENPRWAVFGYIFGDGNYDDDNSMQKSDKIYKTSGTSGFTSQVSEGSGYFYYAIPKSLKKVTITLQTNIPNYAFNNCDLLETITFIQPTKTIGNYSFSNCSELKMFSMSSSVESIGNGAFMNCARFSNIVIPDGTISIGEYAFWGLVNVTNVIVPNSVKNIGFGAFCQCSSLEKITLPFIGINSNPDNPRWAVLGYIFGDNDTDDTMEKSSKIYKTSGTNGFTSQVSEGSGYFYYAIPKSLKTVRVTSQTTVPDHAFNNCDLLETIIYSSIVSKGENSFTNCSATIIEGN